MQHIRHIFSQRWFSFDLYRCMKLGHLRTLQPAWFFASALMGVMTLGFWFGQWVDDRTLLGVSVWTKPFKFSLSLVFYFLTLMLFARFVSRQSWQTLSGRAIVLISLSMAAFEMSYIIWQAALGEASHFNVSTPFHRLMYSLMAFGAICLVAILPWYAVIIARDSGWRIMSNPLLLSVVIGLVLTCALGGGFGLYLGGHGSHLVGNSVSDANGVPLFNWSRQVGDLRVAHFFGMHAMQAVPLFALLLPKALNISTRTWLVLGFGAAYSIFTTATFIQALNGQPFIG